MCAVDEEHLASQLAAEVLAPTEAKSPRGTPSLPGSDMSWTADAAPTQTMPTSAFAAAAYEAEPEEGTAQYHPTADSAMHTHLPDYVTYAADADPYDYQAGYAYPDPYQAGAGDAAYGADSYVPLPRPLHVNAPRFPAYEGPAERTYVGSPHPFGRSRFADELRVRIAYSLAPYMCVCYLGHRVGNTCGASCVRHPAPAGIVVKPVAVPMPSFM